MKANPDNPECIRLKSCGIDPQAEVDRHLAEADKHLDAWLKLPWYRIQERHNERWFVEFHRNYARKLTGP